MECRITKLIDISIWLAYYCYRRSIGCLSNSASNIRWQCWLFSQQYFHTYIRRWLLAIVHWPLRPYIGIDFAFHGFRYSALSVWNSVGYLRQISEAFSLHILQISTQNFRFQFQPGLFPLSTATSASEVTPGAVEILLLLLSFIYLFFGINSVKKTVSKKHGIELLEIASLRCVKKTGSFPHIAWGVAYNAAQIHLYYYYYYYY